MSDNFDFLSAEQIWNQATEAVRREQTAYFINREPIEGESVTIGPFRVAEEARDVFESIHPAFDGGSLNLTKVVSPIPGMSANELRKLAMQEEYSDGDPDEERWFTIYDKSRTVVAREAWESKWTYGEVDWSHKGKKYEPSFLAEIAR